MDDQSSFSIPPFLIYLAILIVGIVVGKLDTIVTGGLKKRTEDTKRKQLEADLDAAKRRSQELAGQNKELQERLASAQLPEDGSSAGSEVRIQTLQAQVNNLQSQLAQRPGSAIQGEGDAPLRVQQSSGLWQVFLDGKSIRPESLSAEERARLLSIVVQMRPWLDAKVAQTPAPAAPSLPAPVASPIINSPSAAYMALSTPKPAPPPPAAPVSSKPQPVAPVPVTLQSAFGARKPASAPPPMLSIVSMIDDILQQDIADTELVQRGLRLESGPYGEVIVVLDDNKYEGVDSVPDPQIRAVIQRAITKFNS